MFDLVSRREERTDNKTFIAYLYIYKIISPHGYKKDSKKFTFDINSTETDVGGEISRASGTLNITHVLSTKLFILIFTVRV